jgi:hypothetical protein
MINDRALLPRYALSDFHQSYLHPRPDFVQTHRTFLALAIIPPDVILRKRHDVLGVSPLRSRRHLRRGGLVPAIHARA